MALDKVIDSAELDANLTAVADAIRTKGGTVGELEFPSGFVSAVEGISGGGEEIFISEYCQQYTKRMIIPDGSYSGLIGLRNAPELEYLEVNGNGGVFGGQYMFAYNPKLKTAIINRVLRYTNNNGEFRNCTALEYIQFGGLGKPMTDMQDSNIMRGCTQTGLVIVVYVKAETLADIPTTVTNASPWNATNATVIYRNSTTGEVITE